MDANALNVITEASQRVNELFGKEVHSTYILGSLAANKFRPLVSDIDLAVIFRTEDTYKGTDLNSWYRSLNASHKNPLQKRLSIFWSDLKNLELGHASGRFPSIDRLDLIKNGIYLSGSQESFKICRPSKEELVTEGRDFTIKYILNQRLESLFHSPKKLFESDFLWLTKLILFPVRLIYTKETGLIGRNEESVKYYLEHYSDCQSIVLVSECLQWRSSKPDIESAANIISKNISLLYRTFFEAYDIEANDLLFK